MFCLILDNRKAAFDNMERGTGPRLKLRATEMANLRSGGGKSVEEFTGIKNIWNSLDLNVWLAGVFWYHLSGLVVEGPLLLHLLLIIFSEHNVILTYPSRLGYQERVV